MAPQTGIQTPYSFLENLPAPPPPPAQDEQRVVMLRSAYIHPAYRILAAHWLVLQGGPPKAGERNPRHKLCLWNDNGNR